MVIIIKENALSCSQGSNMDTYEASGNVGYTINVIRD